MPDEIDFIILLCGFCLAHLQLCQKRASKMGVNFILSFGIYLYVAAIFLGLYVLSSNLKT